MGLSFLLSLLSSFFFVEDGAGVGVAVELLVADGVALSDGDGLIDGVGELLVEGLAEVAGPLLAEAGAEAPSLGVSEGLAEGARAPSSLLCSPPEFPEPSDDFSGVRVRLGLVEGEGAKDGASSPGVSSRACDGCSDCLPRSDSDVSLRSRDADADGLGAVGVSITGAGVGVCATVRACETVKPSLCELSAKVVVLTSWGVFTAMS